MERRRSIFRFLKKQTEPQQKYDPAQLTPMIRASICTGEKTAGFRENATGRFLEVMLIRTPDDLAAFREKYGITDQIGTMY